MVTELLRDPAEEELGLVEGVDLVMRAGQNGPLSPAVGSRSGCPTRNQLSLGVPAEPPLPPWAAVTTTYSRAAATAAAREQRSKKQAEKNVAAAAKASAKKLAGTVPNNTLTPFKK
jgi:hypothetical protein